MITTEQKSISEIYGINKTKHKNTEGEKIIECYQTKKADRKRKKKNQQDRKVTNQREDIFKQYLQ